MSAKISLQVEKEALMVLDRLVLRIKKNSGVGICRIIFTLVLGSFCSAVVSNEYSHAQTIQQIDSQQIDGDKGELAPTSPPEVFDDSRMNAKLIAGIQRLKKAKKVVKTEELLKQLSRRKCSESISLATYGKPLSDTELFKRCRKSVLMLGQNYKCGFCPRWHANVASGFVISKDGLAVTNYHVVASWKGKKPPKKSKGKEGQVPKPKFETPKGLGSVAAMTFDGKVYPVVEVLAASKEDDLAIIRLEGKGLTPLPLSYRSEVGQKVIAITHPKNQYFSFSTGVVTRHFRERKPRQRPVNRMSISADYAGGSSGGPIINNFGEVVGVVIYTREIFSDQRQKKGLQMVLKGCAPVSSIMKLLGAKTKQENSKS